MQLIPNLPLLLLLLLLLLLGFFPLLLRAARRRHWCGWGAGWPPLGPAASALREHGRVSPRLEAGRARRLENTRGEGKGADGTGS